MGVLIDGKWTDGELPQETSQTGQFKRVDSVSVSYTHLTLPTIYSV